MLSTDSLRQSGNLQPLQNRAGRIILGVRGAYRDTPVSNILENLGWVNLESRREYHISLMMFKIINLGPPYLRNRITYVRETHSYSTRNSLNSLLKVPKFRSKTGQRSFIYRGSNAFNRLAPSVRESNSISQFKTNYRNM